MFSKTHHNTVKTTVENQRQRENLKARDRKFITYKGTPIRLSAHFSAQTLQTMGKWDDIFKVMKGKTADKENCIQQHYPSEMKERQRLSQTKKH